MLLSEECSIEGTECDRNLLFLTAAALSDASELKSTSAQAAVFGVLQLEFGAGPLAAGILETAAIVVLVVVVVVEPALLLPLLLLVLLLLLLLLLLASSEAPVAAVASAIPTLSDGAMKRPLFWSKGLKMALVLPGRKLLRDASECLRCWGRKCESCSGSARSGLWRPR